MQCPSCEGLSQQSVTFMLLSIRLVFEPWKYSLSFCLSWAKACGITNCCPSKLYPTWHTNVSFKMLYTAARS